MSHTCGECNLCCDLLLVEEIDKPAHTPCKYLVQGHEGGGCCGLHKAHSGPGQPESCALFYCAWLASQRLPEPFCWPLNLRPNASHVIFGPIDEERQDLLHVNVDPQYPDSWRAPEILAKIREFVAKGCEIKLYIGNASTRFALDALTVKNKAA